MKRILFVDDEPLVLEGLQRMLFSLRHEWDLRFAHSGGEALRLMAKSPADVVVSDMRMPNMNGAQLLNEIMRLYPRTIRFILSGYADQEMILQCVGGTHQFLSKPCDGETLRGVVRRALDMDLWVNNDSLKALVSKLGPLPSLPSLYFDIMKRLGSPETTLDEVGDTIARDPGMTAKILQLVNSAFFGMRRQITDPTEAVLQLGLETIKSLVLGIHVFSEFESPDDGPFSPLKLWRHSLAVAATAKRIAQLERLESKTVEESFTAGLLHDVGRLVLVANLPAPYAQAFYQSCKTGVPLLESERAAFGASHAEVGGYLLGLWGLPPSLVEAVLHHHQPGRSAARAFAPLTAVHVANVLEQTALPDQNPALLAQLDRDYLGAIGLLSRAQIWQKTPRQNRFSQIA